MRYVLDYKDDTTNLNETFYRYHIMTDNNILLMKVWFTQHRNGNIYMVYCNLDYDMFKEFNLYFEVPLDGPYKPRGWYFNIRPTSIDNKSFGDIHRGMQMLQYTANCAMQIFEDEEHKK